MPGAAAQRCNEADERSEARSLRSRLVRSARSSLRALGSAIERAMDSKIPNVVQRYLAGELDIELAARAISTEAEWGLFLTRTDISAADQERMEALFGHTLWLTLRDSSPENVPDTPFSAAEFRQMASGAFSDRPDETPKTLRRPAGNADARCTT